MLIDVQIARFGNRLKHLQLAPEAATPLQPLWEDFLHWTSLVILDEFIREGGGERMALAWLDFVSVTIGCKLGGRKGGGRSIFYCSISLINSSSSSFRSDP